MMLLTTINVVMNATETRHQQASAEREISVVCLHGSKGLRRPTWTTACSTCPKDIGGSALHTRDMISGVTVSSDGVPHAGRRVDAAGGRAGREGCACAAHHAIGSRWRAGHRRAPTARGGHLFSCPTPASVHPSTQCLLRCECGPGVASCMTSMVPECVFLDSAGVCLGP